MLQDLKNIHKLSQSYKKDRLIKKLKISGLVGSLTFFSYLTFAGFEQLNEEKVLAYESLVSAATQDIDSSQFQQAKEKLEEAISIIPNNTSAYLEYGRSLLAERNYEEAIRYIEGEVFNSVEGSKLDSDMYYLIGTAAFELGDYEKAIFNLEQAINLSYSNANYYRDLAISYARVDDYDKANENLVKLQKLETDQALNYYVTGEIQAAQSDYSSAVEQFKNALDASSDETITYKSFIALANLYKSFQSELDDNNVEQRIAILELADKELKNKNDVILTELLAEAYYNKAVYEGDGYEYFTKSINKFQTLLDQGYQRPYIYLNIGIIYQLMESYDESENILLELVEKYPDYHSGYVQLALLYAEIENKKPITDRNFDRVLQYYELAVKNSPNGIETSEIIPLHNLVVELREKGWIK